MHAHRLIVRTLSMILPIALCTAATAQDYPNKSIRIVTAEAGTMNDMATRMIAQGLTRNLKQQVVVENRGGYGSGAIQSTARAAPDGYTLLFWSGALWIGPLIQDLPWDVLRDFAAVAPAVNSPNLLVVHPALPVKSVKELVALALRRPGELNYGWASIGSSTHLAAEMFRSMAGVNITRINYKGGSGALTALMGGEVHLMFATASVKPYLTSGRLRALAIGSSRRSALAPCVPTIAESGVPGYVAVCLHGMFAPAKMPEALIARINQEVARALSRPEAREYFYNAGVEIMGGSAEEFAAMIVADMTKMERVIRDAGIRAELAPL